MNDLKDFLNESLSESHSSTINESSFWTVDKNKKSDIAVLDCAFNGHKKHGYLFYDETIDTVSLVAVDDVDELCDLYNIDEYTAEKIFKMSGDSIDINILSTLGVSAIYKIW